MVEESSEDRHVQVTFFSRQLEIPGTEGAVFDVPLSTDGEQLNVLVNKAASSANRQWEERRFELLIGTNFVHSQLKEFLNENIVDFERVVQVECIDGYQPPKPHLSISGPDWISTVHALEKIILATSYNGELLAYDTKGHKIAENRRENGAIKCCAILAQPKKTVDGLETISGGESGTIWIEEWSASSQEANCSVVAALRGHERSVEAVAVGANGTRLISGSFDKNMKVWNLEESEVDVFHSSAPSKGKKERKETFLMKIPMVTLTGHSDAITALQWSPSDTSRALSASFDHSILVWDLELAGQITRLATSRAFTSMDIHPETGEIVAGSTDNFPRLFDARSTEGSVVKESFSGHRGWITSVKWTRRNDYCFVSASFDNTVKMWDKRSSKTPLFDLEGHEDRVLCLGVGRELIVSGGSDAKINSFTF